MQFQNRQVEGCTLLQPRVAAPLHPETQQSKSLLPSLQHCWKYQTPLAIAPPFSSTTLAGFLQYLLPNFIYRLISSSSNFNFFSLCSSTICKLEITTKILSTQYITAHFPNTALENALRSTS